MKLFKLVGKESVLRLHLEHPIHLDDDVDYRLALTGFYSGNNIYNLKTDGKIYFWTALHTPKTDLASYIKEFTIPKGYWTLDRLQSACREFLKGLGIAVEYDTFRLFKENSKVAIHSPLKLYLDPSICNLLGYKPCKSHSGDINSYHNLNDKIIALNPPNLRAMDVIEVHCNIVERSFVNHSTTWHRHDETEILYTFFPNVPHGYKISETSQEKFYIPLKTGLNKIQEVVITLKDHNNELIVNDDVTNIVYLSLTRERGEV